MEGEIAQQNKIQASIRQETYLLKKSANELQDQIANLSIAMRELKAEERRLSKELVDSPDRIRADLAEANRRLEGVKRGISETQDERATVQRRVEHANIAEEDVGRIASVMEDMDTAVQDYEMAAEDLDNAQNTLHGMEREKESMTEEKGSQEKIFDAAGRFIDMSFFLSLLRSTHPTYRAPISSQFIPRRNQPLPYLSTQRNERRKPRPLSQTRS